MLQWISRYLHWVSSLNIYTEYLHWVSTLDAITQGHWAQPGGDMLQYYLDIYTGYLHKITTQDIYTVQP